MKNLILMIMCHKSCFPCGFLKLTYDATQASFGWCYGVVIRNQKGEGVSATISKEDIDQGT